MAGKKRYGSRANHYRAVKFCKRTRENSFKSAILKTSGFFKTELREEKKQIHHCLSGAWPKMET